MHETVPDIVTRLIRFHRSPPRADRAFRKLKHDRDLLPRLQTQLEIVLGAYGKFEPLVYDTQGVRDDGSDIVLRWRTENASRAEYIGFQVKSFDDLEKDQYLKLLKSQHFESHTAISELRKYFIVLCTDASVHKNKIRSIEAAFKLAENSEVIEPSFAHAFLFMQRTTLEAIVKKTLEAEDYVFREALESLDFSTQSAKALAVFLSVQFVLDGKSRVTFTELAENNVLRSIYEYLRVRQEERIADSVYAYDDESADDEEESFEADDDEDKYYDEDDDHPIVSEHFESQLISDIENVDSYLLQREASESYRIVVDQLRALNAVSLDALVRYQYSVNELYAYMFSVMGIRS